MDAATENLILSQVQRELDAEVSIQTMKLFDARKLTKPELYQELAKGDVEAGTTERHTSWSGEILRVEWGSPQAKAETKRTMSITGLQSGAFRAMLDEMKAEIAAAQNDGVAQVKAAKDEAKTEISTTIANVKAKVKSEVADALQEFAAFTNGGPA
jgi:tagatose-1,6-bisphosphate aldolase non-catalytic subunit AgaZ/GatZ